MSCVVEALLDAGGLEEGSSTSTEDIRSGTPCETQSYDRCSESPHGEAVQRDNARAVGAAQLMVAR